VYYANAGFRPKYQWPATTARGFWLPDGQCDHPEGKAPQMFPVQGTRADHVAPYASTRAAIANSGHTRCGQENRRVLGRIWPSLKCRNPSAESLCDAGAEPGALICRSKHNGRTVFACSDHAARGPRASFSRRSTGPAPTLLAGPVHQQCRRTYTNPFSGQPASKIWRSLCRRVFKAVVRGFYLHEQPVNAERTADPIPVRRCRAR